MPQAQVHPILTHCGLPGVDQIPYGIHMCHFYRERDDLVEALVPFFKAGLHHNERCIWITAEPLEAADAKLELQKAGVDTDEAIRRGALTIQDYRDFYLKAGALKSTQVAALWVAEEERALEQGYSGLRITGNASFITPETWPDFMDYEAAVHKAFEDRRIISLCSYHVRRCRSNEIYDVMRRHSCVLSQPDAGWEIVTGYQELGPEPKLSS
jgi:hypothetical protein